ncbi:hypothetical protein BDZ85DRAFT_117937 [Elsinoe ampelina]|uniref:Uncharacterized protein n=1 Tax=Elsinoe ampelina TaxID=302913 RepID=A0A6A6GAW1_9PEZI|nr:hypothetical protein BDZ85DRAFT_117937 [Elsinoe ampelina]
MSGLTWEAQSDCRQGINTACRSSKFPLIFQSHPDQRQTARSSISSLLKITSSISFPFNHLAIMHTKPIVLTTFAASTVAQRGFDDSSYAGVRNPSARHYFRGEVASGMRMNGELYGNASYVNGEYQAWIDSIQLCQINGQDIPGTGWRGTCHRGIFTRSVVDAVQSVATDGNNRNPGHTRVSYGANTKQRVYVLADAGQGQSCDRKPEAAVARCSDLQGPSSYMSDINFTMDENAAGKRKLKVTCKKACGDAGSPDPTDMTNLVEDTLIPSLRRNGAMAAGFNFHRKSDGMIYARCRVTVAGEVWYDRVTNCPDYVQDSTEFVGQW